MNGFVAVCTLGSTIEINGENVAVSSGCYTENLGIANIVKNIIGNNKIRFLLLCGKEVEGRFPGESMKLLAANGVDGNMRIKGSRGYMPYLKSLTTSEVECFRKQVQIIDMIGTEDAGEIKKRISALENPGEFSGTFESISIPVVDSDSEYDYINKWTADDKPEDNWFIIGIENKRLYIDHYVGYGEQTVRCCRITGSRPETIIAAAIRLNKVTKLYHAAYLGKELQKAYIAMKQGKKYNQEFDME